MDPKVVMSIAGFDPGGGAGTLCDLKTFAALNCYGVCAITAMTIQNTYEIRNILPYSGNQVCAQIDCLLSDFQISAFKTGMMATEDIISRVADLLASLNPINLVVDPVLVSSSGVELFANDAVDRYKTKLFPIATLITPNIFEAQLLSGIEVTSQKSLEHCAISLHELGPKLVLIKGGHFPDISLKIADFSDHETAATDLIYDGSNFTYLNSTYIDTINTHGTGCTLSSAICCHISQGNSVAESIAKAKNYVYESISSARNWSLGKGHGPLNHFWFNPQRDDKSNS